MRRVSYRKVREDANALFGGGSLTSTATAASLNVVINTRAREYWERFYWPEWTIIEARTFRAAYNGSGTTAAGTEVYYAATGGYYRAMRSVPSGNPPAVGGGGSYTTNAAYWAECLGEYSAEDWSASRAYVAGSQVYQPANGIHYQCHTAHTNQEPPNTSYWGVLAPFHRTVDLAGGNQSGATEIGEIKAVWERDPRAGGWSRPMQFWKTGDSAVVRGTQGRVWVEFRLRAPSWTGAAWAAATSYATGDQVWDGTDYYVSIQSGSNKTPATEAAYWTRIDFPYVLAPAVAQAAYADMLRLNGKHSKTGVEMAEAMRLLQAEFDKIERQEGQTTPLNVLTR